MGVGMDRLVGGLAEGLAEESAVELVAGTYMGSVVGMAVEPAARWVEALALLSASQIVGSPGHSSLEAAACNGYLRL
jgi:uncharacterized membrane protein (UPF0136 family)